ncbi:MAG: hypothetical protein LBT24_01305 [Tannerella sp.]|jgi:hypothetical protein|nr:hypothetical protein [Tannerella sp.]
MKRKILCGIVILTLAGATFNVILNDGSTMGALRSLISSVALSSGENESGSESGQVLWVRTDEACTIEYNGAPYSTVLLSNGTTIYLNENGYASYSTGKEKTNCTSGGNEQCSAQYC